MVIKNFFKVFHRCIVKLENILALNNTRAERYLPYYQDYIGQRQLILDVGCGSGEFGEAFAIAGSSVISLDLSKSQLKKCNKDKFERICGDGQHLPFSHELFDCVLSFSLMEHLPMPSVHAKECYRVLRQNGYAIFQLPNLQYIVEPHTKVPLMSALPKRFQAKILHKLNYAYVNFSLTINKAPVFLINEGFRLLKIKKIYHLKMMKILPIAPAYMLILRKPQSNKTR